MTTSTDLAEHVASVWIDGAWSEAPVRAAFEALSHTQAAARTVPGRHTAWEILLHLDAWHRAVARRLRGEAVDLSPEEDWPEPPAATPDNWRAAIATLDAGFKDLLAAVRSFPEERLPEKLPGSRHTAYKTIVGIGEHDLYHAGQVVMLAQ